MSNNYTNYLKKQNVGINFKYSYFKNTGKWVHYLLFLAQEGGRGGGVYFRSLILECKYWAILQAVFSGGPGGGGWQETKKKKKLSTDVPLEILTTTQ